MHTPHTQPVANVVAQLVKLLLASDVGVLITVPFGLLPIQLLARSAWGGSR